MNNIRKSAYFRKKSNAFRFFLNLCVPKKLFYFKDTFLLTYLSILLKNLSTWLKAIDSKFTGRS